MATVTYRRAVPDSAYVGEEEGTGWLAFASMMLGLAGVFCIIDGVMALARSKFYAADAVYVFSDLRTWGWIVLGVGVLAMIAAAGIVTGSQFARWFGIIAAGLDAVAQFMFIQAYPFWAIVVFACDVLVIYALSVYGGKQQEV